MFTNGKYKTRGGFNAIVEGKLKTAGYWGEVHLPYGQTCIAYWTASGECIVKPEYTLLKKGEVNLLDYPTVEELAGFFQSIDKAINGLQNRMDAIESALKSNTPDP